MSHMKDAWPPKTKPKNLEFSFHRDGWAKWYRGQTRIISLKSIDRKAIREAWERRRQQIDAEMMSPIRTGGATVRTALSLFYEWIDHRVKTGLPDPMSPVTAADYKKHLTSFGRSVSPDDLLETMGPTRFQKYAEFLKGCTPTSFTRAVAYVHAFMQWCKDENLITAIPQYGRYFVRPAQQRSRDVRMDQKKSYLPAQLRLLWFHASFEEKLWMIFGLCGAMDNSDLSNLTDEVVNRKERIIDYRRRKRMKIRRVIPLPDLAWDMLDWYERPAPADRSDGDRIFLTPTGLPLQRLKESSRGIANPIDYVSMCWTRLMIRAGLKEQIPRLYRMVNLPRERRVKARGSAAGQGFRALRTTFSNSTPQGFADEREIIMGHAHGTVLLESYLEECGVERLKECVDGVWGKTMLT